MKFITFHILATCAINVGMAMRTVVAAQVISMSQQNQATLMTAHCRHGPSKIPLKHRGSIMKAELLSPVCSARGGFWA